MSVVIKWLHKEIWQKLRLPQRNRKNTSSASFSFPRHADATMLIMVQCECGYKVVT